MSRIRIPPTARPDSPSGAREEPSPRSLLREKNAHLRDALRLIAEEMATVRREIGEEMWARVGGGAGEDATEIFRERLGSMVEWTDPVVAEQWAEVEARWEVAYAAASAAATTVGTAGDPTAAAEPDPSILLGGSPALPTPAAGRGSTLSGGGAVEHDPGAAVADRAGRLGSSSSNPSVLCGGRLSSAPSGAIGRRGRDNRGPDGGGRDPGVAVEGGGEAVKPDIAGGNEPRKSRRSGRPHKRKAGGEVESEESPAPPQKKREAKWQSMFQELCEFRDRMGHSNVTPKHNPALLFWVEYTRRQYRLRESGRKTSLTDEKILALEGIGFVWNPRKVKNEK